jgi:phage terminase small subunit
MPAMPKPVELHAVQGTKVKVGKGNKGNVGRGVSYTRIHKLPEPPAHLGPDGRELWEDFGNEMIAAGIMQKLDLFPLRQLAGLWDRYMNAMRNGEEILAADSSTMRLLFAEFGATPASRRRVATNGSEDKGNPFAGFKQSPAA